jgi:hypothetical protein
VGALAAHAKAADAALLERYVKRDELLLDRIRRLERFETENRKTDSKTGGAECG